MTITLRIEVIAYLDRRCKLLKLILPVVSQGGWTNDQGLLSREGTDINDCLQSLSETHIVCQNTTHTIMCQSFQPLEAYHLIRS